MKKRLDDFILERQGNGNECTVLFCSRLFAFDGWCQHLLKPLEGEKLG